MTLFSVRHGAKGFAVQNQPLWCTAKGHFPYESIQAPEFILEKSGLPYRQSAAGYIRSSENEKKASSHTTT